NLISSSRSATSGRADGQRLFKTPAPIWFEKFATSLRLHRIELLRQGAPDVEKEVPAGGGASIHLCPRLSAPLAAGDRTPGTGSPPSSHAANESSITN